MATQVADWIHSNGKARTSEDEDSQKAKEDQRKKEEQPHIIQSNTLIRSLTSFHLMYNSLHLFPDHYETNFMFYVIAAAMIDVVYVYMKKVLAMGFTALNSSCSPDLVLT